MADESRGPDGWEAEEYDREKIRELREQGMDPASAQQKLAAMGHPSTRSLGTDGRPENQEEPASDEGTAEAESDSAEEDS